MADNLLRPPTPDMQGRELVQWLQRVYDVLREYQTTPDPDPPDIPTSHDDLDDNGGTGSHATITSHIAASTAHGRGSPLVGVTDVQSLANKVIDALNNTITNLRHGTEVDNPATAHGTSSAIAGVADTQTLTNKTLSALLNTITGLRHGTEVDNPTIAHGTSSAVVGVSDTQTLTNKTLGGASNTITGLRHGTEVDNPTAAHGVTQIVGANEAITLKNKDVRRVVKLHSGGSYTALITDDVIITSVAAAITLPAPTAAAIGKVYTVIHAGTVGAVTVSSSGRPINGEITQTIPPGSSMTVVSDSYAWRIV